MRRRRPTRRSVIGLTLVLTLASCGIENDTSPRDVSPADLPDDGADTPSSVAAAAARLRMYLIATPVGGGVEALQAVPRLVEPTPSALFASLVAGPLPGDPEGLRSAVPAGVELRSAPTVRAGTITLDLSAEIDQARGDTLIEAIAQIVFTMSELPSIEAVRMTVEGEVREWPAGDGTLLEDALTEFDYPALNPTSQPDYPALPAPETATSAP